MSRMIELTDAELDAVSGGGLPTVAVARGLVAIAAAIGVDDVTVDVNIGDILTKNETTIQDINVGVVVGGALGQV